MPCALVRLYKSSARAPAPFDRGGDRPSVMSKGGTTAGQQKGRGLLGEIAARFAVLKGRHASYFFVTMTSPLKVWTVTRALPSP